MNSLSGRLQGPGMGGEISLRTQQTRQWTVMISIIEAAHPMPEALVDSLSVMRHTLAMGPGISLHTQI